MNDGAPKGAEASANPETDAKIDVWDAPTRFFHWSLVFQVFVALLTGFIFPEWWMETHIWAGHLIVLFIGFRVVWGFAGSEYSRFDTFIFPVATLIEHVKSVLAKKPKHYVGHNPAGGLMIFGLLIVLFLLTTTGLMILGGEENQGALAAFVNYQAGSAGKVLHSLLSWLLILMILGHVGGVILEGLLTGENLIYSMITGQKDRHPGDVVPRQRPPHVLWGAFATGALVIGAAALVNFLSSFPPSGHVKMDVSDTWKSECADCHMGYHPSHLPAESWRKLMTTLDDHFGEDASLDSATVQELTDYLVKYSAETWDTEAANRFREVDPAEPRRISATPYWVRKHADIKEADFKKSSVKGKANCIACHQDAESGRFDDQKIRIPRE
ncbi:MAG: hypothetical protein A2516_03100 [Alphaproteobacteria bacterium RIFOXYD12_FULL_60_8]|nr:MAG: hypothetical protein A2516_03100 [Alphaproteobacteria bacterium RIFOXYD12_FULL_60_8]